MGHAQKKTEEDGERKPHALIVEFGEKYQPLLDEAKQASQLTYEDAWVSLYREERKAQRGIAKQLGESLVSLGKRLGDDWSSEEDEKELGQIKKEATELRQRKLNFDATTVGPIRATVEKCDALANEIMHRAARTEESTPLINRGLEDRVREAIKAMPRPEWNDKTGQITLLVSQDDSGPEKVTTPQ